MVTAQQPDGLTSALNDTWLSGRPFYCKLCGAGFGEYMACEEPDCELETVADAQERLRKARIEEAKP
jgi:hypothetical protein